MKRALLSSSIAALTALVCLTALPDEAHAIERQHHIGIGPMFSMLKVDDKSTLSVGGGGGIHYAYGLTDQFNLMVEASSAVVAADQDQDFEDSPKTRPKTVSHGSLGVGYVIDILRWVPYVSVLGGVYHLGGGTLPESLILGGVSAGVGLDYQFTRHIAVGVAARQHFMLTKLDTYPSYTTGILRFEYMWGY